MKMFDEAYQRKYRMAHKKERSIYALVFYRRRRQEFFADKQCVDCGGSERLELDHIDPSAKLRNVTWTDNKQRRDLEIKKCVVRCHQCHEKRTAQQQLWHQIVHGLYASYKRKGCRCALCRSANTEHARRQKLRAIAVPYFQLYEQD
jgi:hypothetical protein